MIDHPNEHEVDAIDGAGDEPAVSPDASPEGVVGESLQSALIAMREEADRIASLGASDEQVAAAEQFAEGAGALDEQIGSAARADDTPGQ